MQQIKRRRFCASLNALHKYSQHNYSVRYWTHYTNTVNTTILCVIERITQIVNTTILCVIERITQI
jgi:hypothetical protein